MRHTSSRKRRRSALTKGAIAGSVGVLTIAAGILANQSASGRTSSDSAQPAQAQKTVTVAVAGDICGDACKQTAARVKETAPDAVLTLGDNAYSDGKPEEFEEKYDPTWGAFKDITYPTVGNHEYGTSGAKGYFGYFGDRASGVTGEGYYSFDMGDWHFVALNSETNEIDRGRQADWLRKDLADNTKPCTAAYMHRPQFSTGDHGDDAKDKDRIGELVDTLYENKADLLLSGHDHHYERFAPAKPDGSVDEQNGLRQLVVGTGGTDLRSATNDSAGKTEAVDRKTFGIAKLTLTATGYEHEFVPVEGRDFTDKVSGTCHKAANSAS